MNILQLHVHTVTGKMCAKFKVRCFNHFQAVGILCPKI